MSMIMTALLATATIAWQKPQEVTTGAYARIHRLADGRYMCAYGHGLNTCARFSTDGAQTWGDERIVSRGFAVTNDAGTVKVHLANAEFAQLASGRIVYGVNLRPTGGRFDVQPYAIGVTVSDDGGATWSPLEVVYRAENTADGVSRGCYEPHFLQLPDGTVQLYYADESPYVDGRHKFQEITVMDSADGKTWTRRRAASYAARCRDGMPVGVVDGESIVLAIESNPPGEHLHPYLVRTSLKDPWATPVPFASADRCDPLGDGEDYRLVKAGAPYLACTERHLLLSWQRSDPTAEDKEGFRTVRLAVADRGAFGPGSFRGSFVPPALTNRPMLWNAICPLEGESFLLVGQSCGKIVTCRGEIVDDAGECLAWGAAFADPTLWKGKDGRYYAWATPGSHFDAPYLTSTNGVDWTRAEHGPFKLKEARAWLKGWKWIWAPDYAVVNGQELMYLALVTPDVGSAIGVVRLDADGWAHDLRIITDKKDTGIKDTIDPEVVTDPETGRVWLFFGSTGRMHRVELAPDGLSVRPGAVPEPVAGLTDDENRRRDKVYEGAYLLRRDGWWYLFVSAGYYWDGSYNLRVGRSRTLDGVFTDREGRPMTEGHSTPVLRTKKDSPFYGPGHNGDVLTGADGVERMYYHAHWRALDREQRVMLARPLRWKDGWPHL